MKSEVRTLKLPRGFVSAEYVVVVAALLMALLVPVSGEQNTVDLLVEAMKKEHSGYIYAASLSELPNVCCNAN